MSNKNKPVTTPLKATVSRDDLMAAEAELMKAAADFGRAWGANQTDHPRSYWLELHLTRWNQLARCALVYAECFDVDLEQGKEKK